MKHYPEENTYFEVSTGGWEEAAVILIALFFGGGILLIGWGVWDLLSSDAAQSAFSSAIKAVGYGFTILLVLLGFAGLVYGASFLVKATAPVKLSQGVREHGGMFRTDGIVVVLPKNFHELPPEAQRNIVSALTAQGAERKRLESGVRGEEEWTAERWRS